MKTTRAIFSILIIFIIGILTVRSAFGAIENYYEDLIYQRGYSVPSDIKIIAIDNATLEKLGPYSGWDRFVFADLINILYSGENSPRAVGLDIEFTGKSNEKADEALVHAVENRNVILSSKLEILRKRLQPSDSFEYYVASEETAYDALNKVSKRGFANAILDEDGYLRRAYTTVYSQNDGIRYDSFAVSILRSTGEYESYMPPVVEFGYTGNPGDFEVVSMADVLDGKIQPAHFADSIVLIGAYETGMRDSYSVPIRHGNPMFGVEIQANMIEALRNGRILSTFPLLNNLVLLVVLLALFSAFVYRGSVRKNCILLATMLIAYGALCYILFKTCLIKLPVLYIPFGFILIFLLSLVVRYIEAQKKLAAEMKQTLFSMADSMAEAIEGRTPYNANHTNNVAKRSVEMLHYINKLHKEGKCKYHFSQNDIDQMYLAAMLHDIGKMDIPLEIMDKPTKLGNKEILLRDRLEIIRLHLQNDILTGRISRSDGEERIRIIEGFIEKLDLYNCGKPLSEEEISDVKRLSGLVYECDNGSSFSYLTDEELDSLSIKAGTLSDKERKVMQGHVVYTNKILSHVHFGESFSKVNAIASNHHELLNGKGYPNGIKADGLDVMTRILTIMDIYDSLIADDRPYKKPKTAEVAFEILDRDARDGKVDQELLEIAKELYLK